MGPFDVAIVGAGPAGMGAAVEAVSAGLSVVVLDEQPSPGGQIYRSIETTNRRRCDILGEDYTKGRKLAKAFRGCGVTYLPATTVWNIDSGLTVNFSSTGGSSQLHAGALVIGTGAIERPTPMPGWTLPGVMTAGALQTLLKGAGVVADDAVFVGSGPLVWLIASQMVAAGVKPRAIVETLPRERYLGAAYYLPAALSSWRYLRKGLAMISAVKRAGVPIFRNSSQIRIEGKDRADAVVFSSSGRKHRLEVGIVALHQGIVPNQQITRLLRCEHLWNDRQHCFVPRVDDFFETSVANVFVAGDGAAIGGAVAAELRGRLVAQRIAQREGKGDGAIRDKLLSSLRSEAAIWPLLETLYAPSPEILSPADETLVCRCEEIAAGQIRLAVDLGAPGPNQVKSLLRCGMGPCQGRMCGLAVTEIIAERRGEPPSIVDYYRVRPPLKPLALAELANLKLIPDEAVVE